MTLRPPSESPADGAPTTAPVTGVVVWTMPKVGSTTVYASLQRGVPQLQVYKAHVLSPDGFTAAREHHERRGAPVPEFLAKAADARARMESAAAGEWKIITLVRDPLAQHVSAFFHYVRERHPEALERALAGERAELQRHLQEVLAEFPGKRTRFAAEWFERELRGWLGIDVFAVPFDRARGYGRLPHPRSEALVLRLEDLERCFNEAVVPFLGLPGPIPLIRTNLATERPEAAVYRAILEELVVPPDVVRRYYESPLARHFYTEEERARFAARWSRAAVAATTRQSVP